MASQGSSSTYAPLRFVTQQLAANPEQWNPQATAVLAATLSESKACFLAAQSDQDAHRVSEGPVLVHKIKTQITALLQSRNPSAQYSSILLIKSLIEVGEWSILQGTGHWIKGLIGICGKPNPVISKILSIITLTKIFLIMNGYPPLVRELVTPVLPSFLTACLNLIKGRANSDREDSLTVILPALNELCPYHPASFRPFCAQIRSLILPLMVQTPSDITLPKDFFVVSDSVSESARQLHISLCACAPKNSSAAEWEKNILDIIACTHSTANLVFRALIEDHRPYSRHQPFDQEPSVEQALQDLETREPGFPPWTGVAAGVERLEGLLEMLGAFISSTTPGLIRLPVGEVLQVSERILSIQPPTKDNSVQTRPQISRDEREGLFLGLPRLQIAALNLSNLFISRIGHDAAAVSMTILDQVSRTLESQTPSERLRRAAYDVISEIIHLFGATLPRSRSSKLLQFIKLSCSDLLPTTPPKHNEPTIPSSKQNGTKAPASINPAPYLNLTKPHPPAAHASKETQSSATALLTSALTTLPPSFLPPHHRQQIDRTAILTNNKALMLASTMNPPSSTTTSGSILPFLARAFPSDLEVEALIRPRLPPIQLQRPDRSSSISDNNDGNHLFEPDPPSDQHTHVNDTQPPHSEPQNDLFPTSDHPTPPPPSPKRQKISQPSPPPPLQSTTPNPTPQTATPSSPPPLNPNSNTELDAAPPVPIPLPTPVYETEMETEMDMTAGETSPPEPQPRGEKEVWRDGGAGDGDGGGGSGSGSDSPSVEMSSLDGDDDDDYDDDGGQRDGEGRGEV